MVTHRPFFNLQFKGSHFLIQSLIDMCKKLSQMCKNININSQEAVCQLFLT